MKTFYIKLRVDGKQGDGTKLNPLNGEEGFFDESIKKIKEITYPAPDEQVVINILDGHFKTGGITVGKNWIIQGVGINHTFIELNDVGENSFHHPNPFVIGNAYSGRGSNDPVWSTYLKVSDLTLDAGWLKQSARMIGGVKFAGLQANVTKGLIQKIRIINWGSNGVILEHAEAFPLLMTTYGSEDTQIIIQDCIVEQQHTALGGYCSAIMLRTHQDGGGDITEFGKRISTAAIVRRNKVVGVYGSAFGCGYSENVIYENNKVYGCLTGFNCDTGKNRGIKFSNNSFTRCNEGISIGNQYNGPFENIEISGNTFILTEPWLNKYTEKPTVWYSYGVRLGGKTNNVKIIANLFKSINGLRGLEDKMYGIGAAYSSDTNWKQENNTFVNIKDIIAIDGPLFV